MGFFHLRLNNFIPGFMKTGLNTDLKNCKYLEKFSSFFFQLQPVLGNIYLCCEFNGMLELTHTDCSIFKT